MKRRLAAIPFIACTIFAACGVSFRDPPQGNEFFTSLEVTGAMQTKTDLTAAVSFEQYYPVDVFFECDLVRDKRTIKEIGEETVRALPGGGPDATPYVGNFSFDFSVDETGDYSVECFSPDDEDNIIAKAFSIRKVAPPTPTPVPPSEF